MSFFSQHSKFTFLESVFNLESFDIHHYHLELTSLRISHCATAPHMNRPPALRTVLLIGTCVLYPLLYCPSATCALYCPPVPICYLCTVLSSSPQLRVHISLQTASTLSGTSYSEARFSFFENFKFWSRPGPWLNVLNRKTWIWLCRFQSNLDIYCTVRIKQ